MQVAVLKLDAHCERIKQKAMKTVCCLAGVKSLDVKDGKLTVTGEIDAYMVVKKLKKICHTEIVSVGPEKKPEPKKPDPPKIPDVIYWGPPSCPPYYYPSADENPNACVIF